MTHNIIGAAVCALFGLFVAYVNYALSKKILETKPDKLALATVLRQAVQVGYLIIVYFAGKEFTENSAFLLVGAVVGMTLPMFFFTKKLLKLNEALALKIKEGEEDENG